MHYKLVIGKSTHMEYKSTIGLEIHVELKTRTKMFCDSLNDPDEKHPNINVCPICMGHPGCLPVTNEDAVKKVIAAGLVLNCKIEKDTFFERKSYFYPDLPKGYQISQYQKPLCYGGQLRVGDKDIRITRIHLEEDAGRLYHPTGADYSLVDFNRAGVPLMELVTEPDIESGEEVRKFAEELQLILRYLGVADANMEKGEMRVEVNVSVRPNDKQIKSNGKRIVLKDESYRLMGLLFEVHNKLGPVYKEKNYQDAVEEILKREKVPYEREKEIKLVLENLEVGGFFADFVIDGQILLETKATKFITQEDIRQVLRYLKSANLPLGIIVNFRREKLEYKRLINPKFDNNSFLFGEYPGDLTLGTKVEVKNINSIKFAVDAVDYEIKRQTELLEAGEKVIQETRGWDENKKITFSQRSKEEAHDYRYFPEPDLPPIHFDISDIDGIKSRLSELPQQRRERFAKQYGLPESDIELFTTNKLLGDYFEHVASELLSFDKLDHLKRPAEEHQSKLFKLASNYLITELKRMAEEVYAEPADTKVSPEMLADLVVRIFHGEVSSSGAQTVLKEMFATGEAPGKIIEEKDLAQLSSVGDLEMAVDKVIADNPKAVDDYKKGNQATLKFLIGMVMRESKGKANPQIVEGILLKKLRN